MSDDAAAQAEQALRNVERAVDAAGGSLTDVIKWTIMVTGTDDLAAGFSAFGQVWGRRPNPPAITVQVVAGLAEPDFRVEVEAVAAIPG